MVFRAGNRGGEINSSMGSSGLNKERRRLEPKYALEGEGGCQEEAESRAKIRGGGQE